MKLTKIILLPALLLTLGLAGCQQHNALTVHTRKNSTAILQQAENIWVETGTVNATVTGKGQLKAANMTTVGPAETPTITVTHHGQLTTNNRTVSYQTLKSHTAVASADTKWASLNQLNQALKAAKAPVRLASFKDLTYFQSTTPGSNTTVSGYVAAKQKLYALTLDYPTTLTGPQTIATVYRTGQLKEPAAGLRLNALNGRYVSTGSNDTELRVANGFLYEVKTTTLGQSVQRFGLQVLKDQTASATYTSTWLTASTNAAKVGYTLPKARTIAAADTTSSYLFLSKTTMIQIGAGSSTTFAKSTSGPDNTQPDSEVQAVYTAFDKRANNGQIAISVGALGHHRYEVVLATPSLLTNYYSAATRTYKFATVSGKTVTITDHLTN